MSRIAHGPSRNYESPLRKVGQGFGWTIGKHPHILARMLELEKALHQRCEADRQYETLLAQWTFDKQLVGRALDNVSLIFPHYSLHNASHADTILRQMARVLGSRRIEQLGPTDLWLLLEAAYHHDLGMVVPEETQRSWWTDKKFEPFLHGLIDHSDEEIRGAAALLIKAGEHTAPSDTWPFDVRRALVLIMAEYARPRHAGQSRTYVDAPALLELRSPRTTLVPRRFWSLLGRICESHGKSLRETLQLPKRESGFGMDDAHPRFIACLLRLGDLLDLDDGRFCPVLTRTFGGLPPSSTVHLEKHQSIEEFLVDASEIRVVAECKSPEAYDATEQWCSWLRNELRDQNANWSEISPAPEFGALPSAGKIEVRLLDYHTFPDGRRPRFDVDKDEMLEFVKGAGLYSDETACIAELLQNAVDATLLRIWASDRKKWAEIHENRDDQALEKLREELRQFPIDVQVRKEKGDGANSHWTVIIEDHGAGISKDDIAFLQCVGSSRKNPRRAERMRGMPEWMKPAGYFGIGLQSAFLFTDRVLLRSRADDSLDTIEIELKQRSRSTRGTDRQILVRMLKGEEAFNKPGTRIEFMLREPRVPRRVYWNGLDDETSRVVREYDPLLETELPFLASRVRDAARDYARNTLACLRVEGKAIDSDGGQWRAFFDPETSIEICVHACEGSNLEFLYRGRRVDGRVGPVFLIPLFYLRISWYHGNASQVLTIDRERIRDDAVKDVGFSIRQALVNVLPRYYEQVNANTRPDSHEVKYLALAAVVHPDISQLVAHEKLPQLDQWKSIKYKSSEYTLGDIVAADRVRIIEDLTRLAASKPPEILHAADRREFTITTGLVETYLWKLLQNHHATLDRVTCTAAKGRPIEEWLLQKSPVDDIIATDDVFMDVLNEATHVDIRSIRRTIPCRRRFIKMALAPDAEEQLPHAHPLFNLFSIHVPRAISPFRVGIDKKISLEGVESLVKWTYEHRLEKTTTELAIARAVIDLVQTADKMLRDTWGGRIDYDVNELRRRFHKIYGPEVLP